MEELKAASHGEFTNAVPDQDRARVLDPIHLTSRPLYIACSHLIRAKLLFRTLSCSLPSCSYRLKCMPRTGMCCGKYSCLRETRAYLASSRTQNSNPLHRHAFCYEPVCNPMKSEPSSSQIGYEQSRDRRRCYAGI